MTTSAPLHAPTAAELNHHLEQASVKSRELGQTNMAQHLDEMRASIESQLRAQATGAVVQVADYQSDLTTSSPAERATASRLGAALRARLAHKDVSHEDFLAHLRQDYSNNLAEAAVVAFIDSHPEFYSPSGLPSLFSAKEERVGASPWLAAFENMRISMKHMGGGESSALMALPEIEDDLVRALGSRVGAACGDFVRSTMRVAAPLAQQALSDPNFDAEQVRTRVQQGLAWGEPDLALHYATALAYFTSREVGKAEGSPQLNEVLVEQGRLLGQGLRSVRGEPFVFGVHLFAKALPHVAPSLAQAEGPAFELRTDKKLLLSNVISGTTSFEPSGSDVIDGLVGFHQSKAFAKPTVPKPVQR